MAENPRERRHYYRINDRVHLRVRLLSEHEFQTLHRGPLGADEATGVSTELRALTQQMAKTLATLRKSQPEVARYLEMLDKKIDLLARKVDKPAERLIPDTPVNLGTGGMAFWKGEPMAIDTKLEIRLILFPSYTRITALGVVVRCDEEPRRDDDHRFRIGMEFARLSESERESLARHLIELQSAWLRHRSD